MPDETTLRDALRDVVDPEVGINIVDLGLVYDVEVRENGARIVMTVTSEACPMHGHLARQARRAVENVLGSGAEVVVDITFEPPWKPEMMSDEARRILGA